MRFSKNPVLESVKFEVENSADGSGCNFEGI